MSIWPRNEKHTQVCLDTALPWLELPQMQPDRHHVGSNPLQRVHRRSKSGRIQPEDGSNQSRWRRSPQAWWSSPNVSLRSAKWSLGPPQIGSKTPRSCAMPAPATREPDPVGATGGF